MIDKRELIEEYAKELKQKMKLTPEKFERYNVKPGLRNKDGTGVVVGITDIGDVKGYYIDDGEKIPVEGRLRYRGISLIDLVHGFQSENRFGFEETAYLLIFGELPTKKRLEKFIEFMEKSREMGGEFIQETVLRLPSQDIMNKLGRSVLALYSEDDNPEDFSIANIFRQCVELIARLPLIAAYGLQAKKHYFDGEDLYIHTPKPGYSTAENILHIIRPNGEFSKLEAELLDLCLVIHAEHGGGNNSAFTMHVITSAQTDTYAAMSAAIGSLKGRKHGGANIKVREMIADLKNSVNDINSDKEVRAYLKKVLNKEAFDNSGLIYGMGHAIYTLSDPRAVLLKEKAELLAKEKGRSKEFKLYTMIESITKELFQELKGDDFTICANVDLYSGFVYDMMGIPEDLFTPIFAISRAAGWSAHRIEEILCGRKIIRPAYKNISKKDGYIPLLERTN